MASIATDATSTGVVTGSVTSLTVAHTITGTNTILFAGVTSATTDLISGATFNGVAMTLINKVQTPTDRWTYLFYLVAPASGTHNVVVTASSTVDVIAATNASYTGAQQTGVPDAQTTNTVNPATSITTSVTTVANNCWTLLYTNGLGVASGGTGSTSRIVTGTTNDGIYDSNAAITPAGSHSMTINIGSSTARSVIMASFAPNTSSPSSSPSSSISSSPSSSPSHSISSSPSSSPSSSISS